MLLGARQFFERRGAPAWTNPYVTDGLVAMWDGEWNAGGGVHDANATVWKDLVGDNDFSLAAGGVWGLDNISNGGTPNQIAYRGDFDFNDAPLTQEIVLRYIDKQSSANAVIFHIPQWYDGCSMLRGMMARSSWFKFCTNTSDLVSIPAITYPANFTTTYSASNNRVDCVYVNGASQSLVQGQVDDWYYNDASSVCLGNRSNNNRGVRVEIYRISFYSRALTADEIAANYAIDKARFNLPCTTEP